MRWLASGFFFVIALGCIFVALVSFISHSPDTARGVEVGVGVFFVLAGFAAVYGTVWVFRRWPRSNRRIS